MIFLTRASSNTTAIIFVFFNNMQLMMFIGTRRVGLELNGLVMRRSRASVIVTEHMFMFVNMYCVIARLHITFD
ncbi:hypothetical protein BDF20DRAFT_591243 [Mycotypha africana]|uniref:uncharacterized protein n=1 Tax=Mycotypha africana TaxID=64632 RepID=UPI002300DD06|nr:uncharacterized protein BDF20DRAFT_591243 [Mycotypha africana]KAI8975186.1 hypothetical protein BDF20DRAFT_591243 [Mycotypha africana]